MKEILDPIREALNDASQNPPRTTRLATVTNGTANTVTVRFDGEANASTRNYIVCYAPASINDRVVMLKCGSTWVALCKLPTSTLPADSGWITPTLLNSWITASVTVQYRRISGIVYIRGNVKSTVAVYGQAAFNLPVGFRPGTGLRMANWGGAVNGQVCGTYIDTLSVIPYWGPGANIEHSFDGFTFPAEA